ncbi:MAG: glycosyltransferase family 4 protein [Methylovulum miyakonense]|uniref:glycosyltransferase family 4 protein n=1 Tax=Methylovulum miyakonense TaxID=645578 RepID=UPI003BB6A04E
MSDAFRLAVINSHPIQYFAPLYAYLSRDAELEITALYCSNFSLRNGLDPGFKQAVTWDVDLLSGYSSVFLGEKAKQRVPSGFWSLVCPEIWREIRRGGYDAVWLHGYNYAAFVLALIAAKSKGIPVFMRSETHLGLKRSGWKRWLRDTALSIAYRYFDGFFAIGTANRSYYRALGVPDKKIFDVPYTVDNDRFIAAATLTQEQRTETRKKYGLPLDSPVVLYASKFMRRKHPDDVVRAMASLRDKGLSAVLFLVGNGEMGYELQELVSSLDLHNVIFGGFVNQSELPKVYAASDIFVLPAEDEPWGLIVNEVMCAGIPVVVSEEVGCVPDLVKDNVNGCHMKAGDVASLSTVLEKLVTDSALRRDMGEASLAIIRNWSYEQCRLGISAALHHSGRGR